MVKKFLRRVSKQYSKLGKRRKKKQVWRRPTGRDNKIREKRKGVPAKVSVGYKTSKKETSRINGKIPVQVNNIKDLKKVGKENIAVLGKMGIKKKIELAKHVSGIEFANFNAKKFLKKHSKGKLNSGEKK